jgi:hypothetical protein
MPDMPDLLVRVCALSLAGVFAWSAVAKLLRYPSWRVVLARYRLGSFELVAAPGTPLVELVAPLLVVVGATRAAAAAAVLLLSAFSLAVLRARALEGDRLPCGCFGKTKSRDYRLVLVRNGLLGLLSAVILLGGTDIDVFGGADVPSASEILPAALVVLGAIVLIGAAVSITRSFKRGQT